MEDNYYQPENQQNSSNNYSSSPQSVSVLGGQNYPEQGSAQQGKAHEVKAVNSSMLAKAIAGIIILMLVAFIAYSLIKPAGSTASNPVIALLSTNKPISLHALANAIISTINNTKQINVSYIGSVQLAMKEPLIGNLTETMPMNAVYEKDGNISRESASISGVPILGNVSIVEIANKSVHYSCIDMPALNMLTGNSSSGFKCEKNASAQSSTGALNSSVSSFTNELNMTVKGVKELSYNNEQCYLMQSSGRASMPQNALQSSSMLTSIASPANFTYNITSCISMQYGIPLNLTATIIAGNSTSPMKVVLVLKTIGINTNVNANIASLPGPVVNTSSSTGFGVSPYGSTTPYTNSTGIAGNMTANSTGAAGNMVANQSGYEYSGMYNNSIVVLTYAQTSQIEDLPDANEVGQLQNFYTNNPAYECLNGDTLNVYTAQHEYPGYYIADNIMQPSSKCAYITLLFKQ